MNILGLFGIIAAMVLLIILVYKGMSNIYIAPLCALLVNYHQRPSHFIHL